MPLLRVGFALLLVVGTVPVVGAYWTNADHALAGPANGTTDTPGTQNRTTERPSTRRLSVVTIDGTGPGQILAFDAAGDAVYRNRSWGLYHDVDPSPAGSATVTYVASGFPPGSECPTDAGCIKNVVERVNLTTGNVTRLYTQVGPRNGSSQIHDVDRVNESVLLVGDISFPDRVYMVNTTTGETIWQWRVSEAYEPKSGGQYPGDWTHLNDVEYLADGRVMVSLRNQDQVVFLDPGRGLLETRTLGEDGDHSILYEAHNPDYIPRSRGGPAVVVADSENNRVVEYQRMDGEWTRTWVWTDSKVQWPRDADRLPNGNTLIADTHGNRLLEVAPDGEIAWKMSVPDGTYDVERLRTGDESAGGRSMWRLRHPELSRNGSIGGGDRSAGAVRVTPEDRGFDGRVRAVVTSLVPPLLLHGLLFVLPGWVDAFAAVVLLFDGLLVATWAVLEVASEFGRPGR